MPRQVDASVALVGPVHANVTWNLTYPMDVFPAGLWHNVEYRMKGESEWQNVVSKGFFFRFKV